ncbi:8441_t:CDS:2 [Scutellospora calospora]|uniref:8441_t:CDS:1 n=1 Tax=Scutellospora calospora TaxID=85575 RepID=A0ACA9L363_9GLOM|nr:8441_t:CDS:2 [Scutellospora calospora]
MSPILLFDNALKKVGIEIYDYNDFIILEKIGENKSGNVEKARWKSNGLNVTVKSLEFEMDLNEDIIQEFVVELQPQASSYKILQLNTKNLLNDYMPSPSTTSPKEENFLEHLKTFVQIEPNMSDLIRDEHFKLISKWINKTPPKSGIIRKILAKKKPKIKQNYDFKLLIRGSRDGFTAADFHDKCDNKGPTLIILKVKDENEILGGYNPFSWESPSEIKFYYTQKSFLCNLDVNKPENSILSRARQHESITSSKDYGPYFRGDLCMSKNFNTDCDCRCYRWYYEKSIRKSIENFSIEEYEVFQVIKSNNSINR